MQPVLGVTGDFFGKTRLMNVCVLIVALAALVCAVATSFSLLVAMRVAGRAGGGRRVPDGMALVGDLVPINQRQVAIARLLGVALTAQRARRLDRRRDRRPVRLARRVRGARTFSLLVVRSLAFCRFRNVAVAEPPAPFNRAAVIANFRSIFADPRAKVCFVSVFLEAIFIHGLFPYVAILLLGIGETRASIAGLLIACLRDRRRRLFARRCRY